MSIRTAGRGLFASERAKIERALRRYLPSTPAVPDRLHMAMSYVLFPGGKRLRPVLALLSCRALGGNSSEVLPAACALEFIHNYSLVHDDLPAMDNDDLRRGRPTCHKKFGEAMAILAGDALQTLAYDVVARYTPSPSRAVRIIYHIAAAAGARGMVGGQALDTFPDRATELSDIHRRKTAALFAASSAVGAIAAGATGTRTRRMERFGQHVGLVFQIVDDILDVERSTAELGKTSGKDAKQGKMTYPSRYGLKKSKFLAQKYAQRAKRILELSRLRDSALIGFVDSIVDSCKP